MSDKHTVEMTNGADTIYAPAEQQDYFAAAGYKPTTTAAKKTATQNQETSR